MANRVMRIVVVSIILAISGIACGNLYMRIPGVTLLGSWMVNLGTDRPLENSEMSTMAPAGVEVTPITAGTAGTLNFTGGTSASSFTGTISASYWVDSQNGLSPGSSLARVFDGTSDFYASYWLNAETAIGATLGCTMYFPWGQTGCSLNGGQISKADIKQSGKLNAKVFATNRGPDDFGTSNTLSVKKYIIRQISNIRTGDDNPLFGALFGEKLLFRADASTGEKLFAYDAAGDKIRQVTNLTDGGSDMLSAFIKVGNYLFFAGNEAGSAYYYRYDGSSILKVTSELKGVQVPVFVGDKLYARGDYNADLGKLVEIDPEALNAKKISTFEIDSLWTLAYNGKVFFVDTALKKLNSYKPGESAAKTVSNTAGIGNVDNVTKPFVYHDKLYFWANNISGKTKLYSYDDQTGNLVLLSDTNPSGSDFSGNSQFLIYHDRLYFMARDVSGFNKLHRYNDSNGELIKISNLRSGFDDMPMAEPMFLHNEKFYFIGYNSQTMLKLYRYDDISSQIVQVLDMRGPVFSDQVTGVFSYGDRLYFAGEAVSGIKKLFAYNDQTNTAVQVSNTAGDFLPDMPEPLGIYRNSFYFKAKNSSGFTKIYSLCDTEMGCQ